MSEMMNPHIPPLLLEMAVSEPFRIVLAIWVAFLGGCIGSFMNVVVYRLPRRQSLVYPGSACPNCGHVIRWYHNIPMLGWIVLRGRCYDCGRPIAPRYPTVEAIVAAVFLLTALFGPLSPDHLDDEVLVVDPLEWLALVYRWLLLCTLFCLALIELDSLPEQFTRYVRRLWCGVAVIGIALPLIWPELLIWRPTSSSNRLVDATVSLLCGAGAGYLLGRAAWLATDMGPSGASGRHTALANLVLVGIFLGLPLVCLAGAAAACVNLMLLTWPRPNRGVTLPWSLALFAVTVVGMVCAGANLQWLQVGWLDALWWLAVSIVVVWIASWLLRNALRVHRVGR